jgi:Spy/CpxP family protein refolding chaperone
MNFLMKKLILAVVALVAMVSVVGAQGAPQGGGAPALTAEQKAQIKQMREKQYATLKKELGLTDKQVKDLRAGDDKLQAKAMAIMSGPGDMASKQQKAMGLQGEMKAHYKKVLTPAQFKKLEAMMEKRMKSARGGAPGGGN